MPKKRPFFEYKGLAGLVEVVNNATGQGNQSFRSDDIPYTNEVEASRYRSQRHRHRHSRSHSRSRSRSKSRTHSHRHSHYHNHRHHSSRQHRQQRHQRQQQVQRTAPSAKRPPPPPPFRDDDDESNNPGSPEPSYTLRASAARAEREARAKAAATAAAAGVGVGAAATAAGIALNNQNGNDNDENDNGPPSAPPSHYSNGDDDDKNLNMNRPPTQPQPPYQPQFGYNGPPPRPPPTDAVSGAITGAVSGAMSVQQQNTQKTFPQRFFEGVRNLFPRRYQQQANPYMFDATTEAGMTQGGMTQGGMTQGGMTQGGMTQGGMTQGGTTQAGMTQAGVTQAGMTGGYTQAGLTQRFTQAGGTQAGMTQPPMSGITSRPPSEQKSKDEIARERRNRQLKTLGKIAAVAAGGLVLSRAITGWRRSKKKKKSKKSGDDSEDDDGESRYSGDDDDDRSDYHGGGGPNPLKLKPPDAFLSAKAPQGETFIIERGGKFHRELSGGSTLLIPFMDRIAFRHTRREFGFPLQPTECFTRDSIGIDVTAIMFLRIEDAVAASYEVQNLNHSIQLMGLSCMKKEIIRISLTDVFSKRDALTQRIVRTMNEAIRPWGLRCIRFEFEELEIPPEVRDSMEREARAERLRHADILFSEGQRQALINKADAEMQAQMRMSQARQMDIVNQAIGEAHAIQERGEAIANAMRDVAEVVNEPGGQQAMRLRIAEQYMNAYALANQGNGSNPNRRPPRGGPQLPHDPSQVAEAMNHAIGLLSTLGDPSGNGSANPYVNQPDPSAAPLNPEGLQRRPRPGNPTTVPPYQEPSPSYNSPPPTAPYNRNPQPHQMHSQSSASPHQHDDEHENDDTMYRNQTEVVDGDDDDVDERELMGQGAGMEYNRYGFHERERIPRVRIAESIVIDDRRRM